jgi:hypothetical protein
MATKVQNRIEQDSGGQQREGNTSWALPHDPRTNSRPLGNGDLDREAVDKGREQLEAVLGR